MDDINYLGVSVADTEQTCSLSQIESVSFDNMSLTANHCRV